MNQQNPSPPMAKKRPMKFSIHGDTRIDNYHWLRLTDEQKRASKKDSQTKEVLEYLQRENNYYKEHTKETLPFQENLFKEIKARIKEQDSSVPYFKNGYYYITRYEKGKQYPIYTRKKGTLQAEEEVLLEVNQLAADFEYYQIGGLAVSPNNHLLIYGVDTVSRRQYTLYLKDLQTGKTEKLIENTTGGAVWANDNETIFYTKKNKTTLRSQYIFRYHLKERKPIQIYEETHEAFSVFVAKSKSKKYVMIGSFSTTSTEYRFLEADNPFGAFQVFQKRQRDLEYSIAHYGAHFYILTNKDKAFNFKLMKTPISQTSKEYWQEVIPHRKEVLLEGITIFKQYLVLEERERGLNAINVKRWDGTNDYYLSFQEETYTAEVVFNPEFDTQKLRYVYSSMTTPNSVIDFDMQTKKQTIVKEQEVLGGDFNKENYTSKRIWAVARDNQKIAISIVKHKNTRFSAQTPFLLYAYGSYGHTINPSFSITRLSLLNRGFVYGIAHVRGGEYMGRHWYESGKLQQKKNTFYDFIDCSQYLIDNHYTSAEHLYAMGGSAGGLLMGVIINQAPYLYKGIIANVPFVDMINTMLDETIPLTSGEYDEWGNPNKKEDYFYMKSYAPYENIKESYFPNLLITAGLHDSQVQYWEPAKWIAKLREFHKGNTKLFLHTNMQTGHSGASGRFDALKEIAKEMSFLLNLERKTEK